jgi:hypothetical protein
MNNSSILSTLLYNLITTTTITITTTTTTTTTKSMFIEYY